MNIFNDNLSDSNAIPFSFLFYLTFVASSHAKIATREIMKTLEKKNNRPEAEQPVISRKNMTF